ncbi:MAG: hypothetical protein ACI3YH_03360 [Eubacteriales bacterium]
MYPVLADFHFQINPGAFVDSLSTMGLGMLGIFLITGVIVLAVSLLNYFTKPRQKD